MLEPYVKREELVEIIETTTARIMAESERRWADHMKWGDDILKALHSEGDETRKDIREIRMDVKAIRKNGGT